MAAILLGLSLLKADNLRFKIESLQVRRESLQVRSESLEARRESKMVQTQNLEYQRNNNETLKDSILGTLPSFCSLALFTLNVSLAIDRKDTMVGEALGINARRSELNYAFSRNGRSDQKVKEEMKEVDFMMEEESRGRTVILS